MKKHTLCVFLLVVFFIPLLLSCNFDRNTGEQQTKTTTPEIIHIPTIYPTPTSDAYRFESKVNALNRLLLYDDAIAEMNGNHDYTLDPFTYTDICLQSSLHNHAADVMPICDFAVQEFPDYEETYFARGIARSIIGDNDGAISDFETFLEKLNSPPEKNVNKSFKFETDIHIYEDRILSWIEKLKNQQNPITREESIIIPGFIYTKWLTGDIEYMRLVYEQRTMLEYKYYKSFIQNFHEIFQGHNYLREIDDKDSQQDYITFSLYFDLQSYSTACMYGCFVGDIDKVYRYCQRVDEIYASIPDYVFDSPTLEYRLRNTTLSTGVYKVYSGDYDGAKIFFEDYLQWLSTPEINNEQPVFMDEIILEWINKLENNEFPFTDQEVYFLMLYYPYP